MLEVVIVALEWPESNGESNGYVGFEHCALREDLVDCHVLSV